MQRQPSDSSTNSVSRLRRIGSRLRRLGGSKGENGQVVSVCSDSRQLRQLITSQSPLTPAPQIQKFVHELDSTETASPFPPDSVENDSDDPSLQQLRDNIRRLNGASLGVNGVDSTFAVYSRCSKQSLELCKALVQKSSQYYPSVDDPFTFKS